MGKYSKNHTEYFNDKGVEVPSVTTILKILNKPTLVPWANFLGWKRQKVADILTESSLKGVMVHALIESNLLDKYFLFIPVKGCDYHILSTIFRNFLGWKEKNDIEAEFMEKKIVADKFGGTIDFYGNINGKKTIMDIKTSKGLYIGMVLQLAAYTILLEQEGYEYEQVAILNINEKECKLTTFSKEYIQKYRDIYLKLADLFVPYFDAGKEDKWGDLIG